MSGIVDALYELKYNPFEYGPYISSFYSSLGSLESNFLLAPLVIPLCSHPFFSIKLEGSNANSTLWTVFGGETKINNARDQEKYERYLSNASKNKISHKEKLYDLQERIDGFQGLTELCIQYCLVNDWLSVDEDKLILCPSVESDFTFTNQKSAEKLGRLFSSHSVVEIYAFLGVKPR